LDVKLHHHAGLRVTDVKKRSPRKLIKQIGVAASADEDDFAWCNFIDEKPVCFDVALPHTFPLAAKLVRPIIGGEAPVLTKKFDDRDQLFNIPAAPKLSLQVGTKTYLLNDAPHRFS
jgi:hypothetical protein